jgi:hypothetical protein
MGNDLIFGSTPEGGAGKVSGQYFIIGRVTSVVLGQYLDDGKTLNPNWTSDADLGKIDFDILYTGLTTRRANKVSKSAWPIFSFFKQYPLVNEIVYIVSGPTDGLNDNYKNQKLFYYPPFSLWNSVNHNAFPNMDQYSEFLQYYYQQPGYQGSAATQPAKLPLGTYFEENEKVKTIRPFEGDSIIESRFGQSIRFGSSNFYRGDNDTWSAGTAVTGLGKPITVIINGQGIPTARNSDKFSTTVEDISRDDASIYLTSGQILRTLNVSDIKGEKYTFPYAGNQALITSDRVMLYSKKENVLLYARQNIGLASINNITLNSDQAIVTSNKIFLGDVSAKESVIKGDIFTRELVSVLQDLKTAAINISKFSDTDPGASAQALRIAGITIQKTTERMINFLSPISGEKGDHLSKITYTK